MVFDSFIFVCFFYRNQRSKIFYIIEENREGFLLDILCADYGKRIIPKLSKLIHNCCHISPIALYEISYRIDAKTSPHFAIIFSYQPCPHNDSARSRILRVYYRLPTFKVALSRQRLVKNKNKISRGTTWKLANYSSWWGGHGGNMEHGGTALSSKDVFDILEESCQKISMPFNHLINW